MSSTATRPAPVRVLSESEVAAYHRDGFLIVRNLYPPDTMLEWKRRVIEILGEQKQNILSGVRVWFLETLAPYFKEAMRDNHVVPILTQIIGPDVEFLSVKTVFKDAGVEFGTPWHQDWYYWFGPEKISIWIALDNATRENGCLRVMPGTHKMQFQNQSVQAKEGFTNRLDPKELEGLPIVDAILKRGDVVFFSDREVHGSHPNRVKADRWSFISTYRNAAVLDDSKVWKSSMVVAGKSVNAGAGNGNP